MSMEVERTHDNDEISILVSVAMEAKRATEVSKEEEEEERQPFQLTAVMKRPSFENDLTSRQEDNSPSEDLRTSFVLGRSPPRPPFGYCR